MSHFTLGITPLGLIRVTNAVEQPRYEHLFPVLSLALQWPRVGNNTFGTNISFNL